MRDADIEKRIFYFCSSMFAAGSDAGTDSPGRRDNMEYYYNYIFLKFLIFHMLMYQFCQILLY